MLSLHPFAWIQSPMRNTVTLLGNTVTLLGNTVTLLGNFRRMLITNFNKENVFTKYELHISVGIKHAFKGKVLETS